MLTAIFTDFGKRDLMVAEQKETYNLTYLPARETYVIKKDGSLEAFDVQKVIDAIGKSAYRALTQFTDAEKSISVKS